MLQNFADQYTRFKHNQCLSKGLKNWRWIKLWNSSFRCN